MAAAGFRLMRLFVLWDLTEPRSGQWDWAAYDAAFDAAQNHGLGVVPTLMAQSPPGWMRVTNGSQAIGDVDDPGYWQSALAWTAEVALRYATHPALHSWILWNEASRVIEPDHPDAQVAYRHWLRKRWENDIDAYNRRVFKQYDSFDQVLEQPNARTAELAFKANTQAIDWLWFTVDDLMSRLNDIAAVVRQHDPNHPLHVNPHNIGASVLAAGQSLWREAAVVDFLGCSAHAPWHSLRFPTDRVHQSIACFSDMTRATSPDPEGRFWISELQGGPTLYSAETGSYLTPEALRRWLWLGLGGGAEAIVFWGYNQRREGYEAGEWGLIGLDGQSTARLAVCRDVADTLEHHQDIFACAKPIVPNIVILHDEDAEALFHIDGSGNDVTNPRNCNAYHDGLCGAWLWASQLGHEVGFVHADHLRQHGVPGNIDVILAPSTTCLDERLAELLQEFCHTGGTLIADGLCGFKTPDGIIAETAPALAQLFGGHLHDAGAQTASSWQWNDASTSTPWWLRCHLSPLAPGRVLARWADEQAPAVITRPHGTQGGQAIWLGSLCFQALLQDPEQDILAALQENASTPHLWQPQGVLHLVHQSKDLNQRRQHLPDGGELLTIIAPQHMTSALIRAQADCEYINLLTETQTHLPAQATAEVHLRQGIALLKIHPTSTAGTPQSP
jgi:beta-galactosidase